MAQQVLSLGGRYVVTTQKQQKLKDVVNKTPTLNKIFIQEEYCGNEIIFFNQPKAFFNPNLILCFIISNTVCI